MSKIGGANSLFFQIAGAKAPITPVLNTPLSIVRSPFGQKSCCHVFKLREYKEKKKGLNTHTDMFSITIEANLTFNLCI